jgi:hypothetical protein
MADQVVSDWTNYLYEMRGELQKLFVNKFVLMKMVDRATPESNGGANREIFSGNQARFPILPYPHASGGFISETGTWNVPSKIVTDKATVTLTRYLLPISVSPDLLMTSLNHSAAKAMATLVETAYVGMARDENSALNGAGDALIASVASGTSPGLTIVFGSASAPANADELAPGRIFDILVRSSGADPGSGLRRLINTSTDNNDGTVTVVFDTAATASDGGSGNITFSSNEGAYLPGSYANPAQGLQQILAVTGTFEGINKATKQYWQGTDGRAGTTTVQPLSISMLDGAIRRLWSANVDGPTFWIGDPASIDLFAQSLYTQNRWAGQTGTLATGYEGVSYKGKILIDEHQHKRGSITGIHVPSLQIYSFKNGPDFLDDDGGIFRRILRSLPKEMDLIDWWNLAAMRCATHVFLNNLARAT